MFYTYVWLREDGTPYYVGKGKGDRGFQSDGHRQRCPSTDRIRAHYWPDEETAYAYERYLIDFYGRIDLGTGTLRNLTDGGEGPSNLSEESIKKMREAASIPLYTDEQIILAYNSSINYVEGAKILNMRPSPFGKRCRKLGLKAKKREYKRALPTCHPGNKHHSHGLCYSCYGIIYRLRNSEGLKEIQSERISN